MGCCSGGVTIGRKWSDSEWEVWLFAGKKQETFNNAAAQHWPNVGSMLPDGGVIFKGCLIELLCLWIRLGEIKQCYSDRNTSGWKRWGGRGTLTQCWFKVGPPSATLAQHWAEIGSVHRVYREDNLGNGQPQRFSWPSLAYMHTKVE